MRVFRRSTQSPPKPSYSRQIPSPTPSQWSAASDIDRRFPSPPSTDPPPTYAQANRPTVDSCTLDFSYRLTLTVDLSFCLVSTPDLVKKIPNSPLKGDWLVEVEHQDGVTRLIFDHGDLPEGLFGRDSVVTTMSLFWLDEVGAAKLVREVSWKGSIPSRRINGDGIAPGHAMLINSRHWSRAASVSDGAYDPVSHRSYRFTVELELVDEEKSSPEGVQTSEEQRLETARLLADLALGVNPYDVRLSFPDIQDGKAELWARSSVLDSSSDVFRVALSTGGLNASPHLEPGRDCVDSDDDTDDFFFSKHPPSGSAHSSLPSHSISVTGIAFTTLRFLLQYADTGERRNFMPLSSSFPLDGETRDEYVAEEQRLYPQLPLPASPKSVVRLAHRLGLKDLESVALAAFSRRLLTENVGHELFGEFCATHDGGRKAAVAFLKEKWEEVRKTSTWEAKMAEVEEGKVEGSAAVLLALMREGLKL